MEINQINALEAQVASGKNEIIDGVKEKMGICPYFQTNEILDDCLVQKESWGGKKDDPANVVKMSQLANVAYGKFAIERNVLKDQPLEYYLELYFEFISSPKPLVSEKDRFVIILKALVSLREAVRKAKQGLERNAGIYGKTLDENLPISETDRIKMHEKFRKENEPLLKQLKDDSFYSWQNIFGYMMANAGYVQKSLVENEIMKNVIQKFPIWTEFGAYIPGFGEWSCAMILAKTIGEDKVTGKKYEGAKRFPKSSDFATLCGISFDKEGRIQKKRAGQQTNYSPALKDLLCKTFPESFWKGHNRNPDEPYSKLIEECLAKQRAKAKLLTVQDVANEFKVPVENVTNLGYKIDPEDETQTPKFQGFKIKRLKAVDEGVLLKAGEEKDSFTKYNPGHVFQRAMRQFSRKFIEDFYHAWLFLEGENPDIAGNPRIMAVFEKVAKAKEESK